MASRNATIEQATIVGMLARPYAWAYSAVIGMFLVFVWLVLANLCFLRWVWASGEGLATISAILEHDAVFAPAWLAQPLGDGVYKVLFEFSGVRGAIEAATTPGANLNQLDRAVVDGLIRPYAEEIAVLMQAARLFGVRLAILAEVLVIASIVGLAAFTDGLVQRYVRRAGAGRESANLYHRAKYLQLGAACLIFLMYPATPVALDPCWLYAWAVLGVGLVSVQAKFYKKYL